MAAFILGPGGLNCGTASNFLRLALILERFTLLAAVVAVEFCVVDELLADVLELPQAAANIVTEANVPIIDNVSVKYRIGLARF